MKNEENEDITKDLSRVFPGMMDGVYELVNINDNTLKALELINKDNKDKSLESFLLNNLDSINKSMSTHLLKSYSHLIKMKSENKGNELTDNISGEDFINAWDEFTDEQGLNVTKILKKGLILSGSKAFSFEDKEIKEKINKEIYSYIQDRIKWSVTTPENNSNSINPFMFDYKEGAKTLSATQNKDHLDDLSKVYYNEIKNHTPNKQEEVVLYLAEKLLANPLSRLKESKTFDIFDIKEKTLIVNKLSKENNYSLIMDRLKEDIQMSSTNLKKPSTPKI